MVRCLNRPPAGRYNVSGNNGAKQKDIQLILHTKFTMLAETHKTRNLIVRFVVDK